MVLKALEAPYRIYKAHARGILNPHLSISKLDGNFIPNYGYLKTLVEKFQNFFIKSLIFKFTNTHLINQTTKPK